MTKSMPLLLAGMLLLICNAPATADERPVLQVDLQIRDYTDLGNYPAAGPGRFYSPDNPPPTHAQACVEEIYGNDARYVIHHAPAGGPFVIPVYQIDNPPITQSDYAIVGQVSYTNVTKPAYLELWSEFPDGGRYFSRTLADSGPLMAFQGTSAARPFRLPFHAKPGQTPNRLTLNLVAADTGEIALSEAAIVETTPPATQPVPAVGPVVDAFPVPPDLTAATLPPGVAAALRESAERQLTALIQGRPGVEQSYTSRLQKFGADHPETQDSHGKLTAWDAQIARLQEALAGPTPAPPGGPIARGLRWVSDHFAAVFLSLVGLSFAILWPMHWLMTHGRGRGVVLGVFAVMVACGIGELFAAGVAFGMNASTNAWASLLGGALILIVVPGLMLRQIGRQYAGLELRKMRAMDVV